MGFRSSRSQRGGARVHVARPALFEVGNGLEQVFDLQDRRHLIDIQNFLAAEPEKYIETLNV
jgi:hypothetical protein